MADSTNSGGVVPGAIDSAGLDKVLGVIQGIMSNLGANKDQISQAYDQVGRAVSAYSGAQVGGIKASGKVALQQDQGNLTAQNNARAAATALGTNMDDPNSEVVTGLGQTLRNSVLKVLQDTKVVGDIEANNDIFTNPAGFMNDLLHGNAARNQLEADTGVMNAASKGLALLNQATQSTTLSQKAIAKTMTAASIQAHQEQIAAEARAAAAQGAKNLATTQVAKLNALNAMDSQQVGYAYKAYMLEYTNSVRAQQLAAQAAVHQTNEVKLYNINKGRAESGLPPFTKLSDSDHFDAKANEFFAHRGQQINAAESAGINIPPPDFSAGTGNPIEALALMRSLGINTTAAMQNVGRVFARAQNGYLDTNKLANALVVNGASPDLKSAKAQALQMLATPSGKKLALEQYSFFVSHNLASGNVPGISPEDNPYTTPPLTAFAIQNLAKTNDFINKYVLDSYVSAKTEGTNMPVDPSGLLGKAYSAVYNDKQPTGKVAEGLSSLMQSITMTMNHTNNYSALGLPDIPGVFVTVGTGTDAKRFNLASKADVTNAIAYQHMLVKNSTPGGTPNFFGIPSQYINALENQ